MVFKFHGIDADGVAVLDAVFLEELVQFHVAPDALETAQGLVIVEVGHGDEVFDAGAGDDEGAVVVTLDFKVRLVLGFIDNFFRRFIRFFHVFFQHRPDPFQELVHAFAGHGADGIDFNAVGGHVVHEPFQVVRIAEEVDFIGRYDLLLARQFFTVFRQFRVDFFIVFDGVAAFDARYVDDVDEDLRPFDMAQEIVAQADAFTGAVDEAGNIGHDEAAVIRQVDDTQNRVERREMVRSHFRLSCRHLAQDARLTDAGIAQKADVSQDFQFQAQPPFFPRFPPFGKGRRPVGTGAEMPVAAAAAAAFGDDGPLAVTG